MSSIIYTLISKGPDKVLCEFTEFHGNFEQISRSLLKRVQINYTATFAYENT